MCSLTDFYKHKTKSKGKTKTQHNKLPWGKSQACQQSLRRQLHPPGNVCFFLCFRLLCQPEGNMALWLGNGMEMGWWGGIAFPLCPEELPMPWCGVNAGLTTGHLTTPQFLAPDCASQSFPALPAGIGTDMRHTPPGSFPTFFFWQQLKLISSSSAHHSSLSDDTNQVVGGFVMAVSYTLIKAISFSRRKHCTI